MKLSAPDAAVTALVVLLSSALIYLYLDERGRNTVRNDERALGTIVFKKRNATRRLKSALVWERIRNDTPVYEADTLRTADGSEAVVRFDDGIDLDLYENSMVRLVFKGKERRLEFLGGNISISGSKAAPGTGAAGVAAGSVAATGAAEVGATAAAYTISVGDKTIELSETASASLSASGDSLSVEVSSGEAVVRGADGGSEIVGRSAAMEINLATGTSQVVERKIVPILPEQNARLLKEGSGPVEVAFSWETTGAAGDEATVELSGDKNFDSIAIAASAKESSIELPVESGSWYWRIRSADGTVSASRRLALYAESPPRPILPASGTELSFRNKSPAVRFSWTRMENATAYLFEVAADRDFSSPIRRDRTTVEGITVADLGEGKWYWRVTPLYAMSRLGEQEEREVRDLLITRKAAMVAPVPTVPAQDTLFLVQEAGDKGIAFSWLPQSEAVEYEVRLSDSPDMERAVVTRSSSRAWTVVEGAEAAPLASPGAWHWAVRWKDAEGNYSPYSEPRRLRGVDGKLAVKLVFPPEGYVIADSLAAGTRFSWKSNLKTTEAFQLSADPSFSRITWEERTEAETLIGKPWKTGTWYWRIATFNADGSRLHETEPRSFRVVDPLAKPGLISPSPDLRLYLRAEDGQKFRWETVPGADYYQFALYAVNGRGEESPLRTTTMEGTELDLPFGTYPEGNYRVRLQAFGLDKPSSTRLIGYLGKFDFSFKPIARPALESPRDGEIIDGLEARRRGIAFSWTYPDAPDRSELIVSRESDFSSVLRADAAAGTAAIPRLSAGDYFWTVAAELQGFDISAPRTYRFSVLPIPLLPAPPQFSPPPGYTFGPAELRKLSCLRFAWDAVRDATDYEFALYRGTEREPLVRSTSLKGVLFELDDFSILDNGEYRWTVTARSFDGKGEIEQDGVEATSTFRIELPPLLIPDQKEKEQFYGR